MTASPVTLSTAVTGMGCLCAAGATVPQTMASLYANKRTPVISQHVRSDHPASYPVLELSAHTQPPGYRQAPQSHLCGMLAIEAASEALGQANVDPEKSGDLRIGVCIGTTVGSRINNESFNREFYLGGRPDIEPIRQYLRANPAAMLSRELGLTGPSATLTNACSSGTVAIAEAAGWISSGLCDMALAGGTDILSRVTHNGFISLRIADTRPCKPFDVDRKGLNLGEGAGLVLLESSKSAQKRGARVLARLRGCGNASDAYHLSAPKPDGMGLRRAIGQAMNQAGLDFGDIGFINAHGTGTPENDHVEGLVFKELLPGVPFVSTKGYTGHTLGAAGGIEAVITISCLLEGQVPGNIGFEQVDPEIGIVPVTETIAVDACYGLSDSVAFGGNNAALVFERGDS